jgi:hypothetical protein
VNARAGSATQLRPGQLGQRADVLGRRVCVCAEGLVVYDLAYGVPQGGLEALRGAVSSGEHRGGGGAYFICFGGRGLVVVASHGGGFVDADRLL